MIIPKQLQNKEFRFCPLIKGKKISGYDHNSKNYTYNDPYFLKILDSGFNYGILGGYGNIIVVDVDSNEMLKEITTLNLPKTFTVLSALKKKPHYYYITENPKKSRSFTGLDLRGIGTYAVCPNSKIINDIKTGKTGIYTVDSDIPINKLDDIQFSKIIEIGEKSKIKIENNKILDTKKINRSNSLFLDKENYIEKPVELIIEDIPRKNQQNRYDIKVSSINGEIQNKSFDLNDFHFLNLLKNALVNMTITIKSEKCIVNNRPALRWVFLDVKK